MRVVRWIDDTGNIVEVLTHAYSGQAYVNPKSDKFSKVEWDYIIEDAYKLIKD